MNASNTDLNHGEKHSTQFHVAFCVDDRYFRAMAATMASIIENNPLQPFTFHVLVFAVSSENRERLKKFDENPLITTIIHEVNLGDFEDLSRYLGSSHYSLSIFTRLIIPTVVQGLTDRVLYLDADILCVGSLDELIAMDVGNEIAVVIPDAPVTTARRVASLGLKDPQYFNGGVMFINVARWIEAGISAKTMDVLATSDKDMRFNDQDALNLVLNGRARFISPRFNYLYDLIHDLNINQTGLRPLGRAVLVHFAGAVKPWCDWSGHDVRDLFRHFLSRSPWAGFPLDSAPINTKEMRMYSRFLFRKGKWRASFGWYLKYLKVKLSKKLVS